MMCRRAKERMHDDEAAARVSVNVQLWKRAHPGEEAVPLDMLLDDRLPDGRRTS